MPKRDYETEEHLLADVTIDEKRKEVRCMARVPDEPGWMAEGVFRLIDDDLYLIAVQVWQWRPSIAKTPAVTARIMRSVSIDGLYEKAREGAHAWLSTYGRHGVPDVPGFFHEVADAGRRVGRAGQDDKAYLPWAVRYADHAGSRAPLVAIAAETGLKREQVRDFVHEARRRGLLADGRRGVAGGYLTDKARKLLAEEEEKR